MSDTHTVRAFLDPEHHPWGARMAALAARDLVSLPESGPTTFDGTATLHQLALDVGLKFTEASGDLALRGTVGDGPADVRIDLTNATARAGGMLAEELALSIVQEDARTLRPAPIVLRVAPDRITHTDVAMMTGVDVGRWGVDCHRHEGADCLCGVRVRARAQHEGNQGKDC